MPAYTRRCLIWSGWEDAIALHLFYLDIHSSILASSCRTYFHIHDVIRSVPPDEDVVAVVHDVLAAAKGNVGSALKYSLSPVESSNTTLGTHKVLASLARNVNAVDVGVSVVQLCAVLLVATFNGPTTLRNTAMASSNPLHLLGVEGEEIVSATMFCDPPLAFCDLQANRDSPHRVLRLHKPLWHEDRGAERSCKGGRNQDSA
jgi:hypothetical protein